MSNEQAKIVQIPSLPEYGFLELKEFIRKNTYKGFIITAVGLILLLLLYFGLTVMTAKKSSNVATQQTVSKINVEAPPEETKEEVKDVQQVQQVEVNYGSATIAGNPIAVPDAEITVDNFASISDIDKSMSEVGNVDINEAVDLQLGDKPVVYQAAAVEETIPDETAFVSVEKDPGFDFDELQKRVRYPENAQRLGIEGKVLVRTFIDKAGKPTRTKVIESPSKMLDQAAIDAVNRTVFTPAINNGTPVGIWFEIPIEFSLKK